jgi:hypothetical protein
MFQVQSFKSLRTLNIELLNLELSPLSHSLRVPRFRQGHPVYFSVFFKTRMAVSASAALSKAR